MRFFLLLTLALWIQNIQGQTKTTVPVSTDRAIVTPMRIERVTGRGEDASTDVTITPIITGLPNTILKPIQKELNLKKVLGEDHYELFKKKRTCNLDYDVTYNRDHILGLTFSWMSWFNYIEKTVAFDLKNGKLIELSELFLEERMEELATLVNDRLQSEIKDMIKDYQGEVDLAWTIKAQGPLKVTTDNLRDFSVSEKGITLFFHARFYHVYSWAEPKGRYFFTYADLKPFLKPQSPVSQFLN